MKIYPNHDCAHEDEPGLRFLHFGAVDGFYVAHWMCKVCTAVWWLIDDTFFDPDEWGSVEDIMTRSQS